MKMLKVLLLAAALAVLASGLAYWLAPTQFLSGAVRVERALSGLQRHEVDIPGFRIAYLDSGGSGTPLILVHGFGGDKDNWVRVARPLRTSFRVIALDLPGYGESDAPRDGTYTIGAQVEHLQAFMRALGLSHAHLGGNSMGGNIVAHYAARWPNQVGSLWLVASAGVGSAPVSELRRRIAETGQNGLIAKTPEQFRELLDWVMAQPPPLPPRVLDVLAQRAVAAHALRERQFAQLVQEGATLESTLAGLPVPVHILWGDRDRVLDVGAVPILRALLPQSSATVLPGIGHLPMLEAPEPAAQDYLAFRAHPPTVR